MGVVVGGDPDLPIGAIAEDVTPIQLRQRATAVDVAPDHAFAFRYVA